MKRMVRGLDGGENFVGREFVGNGLVRCGFWCRGFRVGKKYLVW